MGSFHKYTNDPPYEVDVVIKAIFIHPLYQSQGAFSSESYDISLVQLSQDVFPFNNHTNSVCLPKSGTIVPAGTECVTTGWGDTKWGK